MAAALAEHPISIEAPDDVDPRLRLVQSDESHEGGGGPSTDTERVKPFVDAPVVLGVRRPEQFRARLVAGPANDAPQLNAFADMAMREVRDERAVVLRLEAGALTVALITVLDPSKPITGPGDIDPPILFWSLAAQSGDATARAETLDFLKALHVTGALRVFNEDAGERIAALEGEPQEFDDDLERDFAFLRDVATLEEWSDLVLPLPREVGAEEVARIQQAAMFVRSREVPTRFVGDIEAVVTGDVVEADELVLEQDFGVAVFGYDVPLGTGQARFAVKVVETAPDPVDPSRRRAKFRTTAPDGQVVFALTPPPERVARRWTLAEGEQPADDGDERWLDDEWVAGEREVDRELREGRGVRFTGEDAFFAWLADPDAGAAA